MNPPTARPPSKSNRILSRKGRTAALMALAVLAVVASRVPLMLDNPDSGFLLGHDYCSVFSALVIRDHLEACTGQESLSLSQIDPEQVDLHYHLGSKYLYEATAALYELTGSRSLLLIKILGTALTAFFALALAWALSGLYGGRWLPVLVPLFLIVAPPGFFLWLSLLPRGHYFEHHFFYALFLPFMLLEARDKLSLLSLAALGALGGFATAYTISNVLLPAAVLACYLLNLVRRSDLDLGKRLIAGSKLLIALGTGALAFTVFGRVWAILSRLGVGLKGRDAPSGAGESMITESGGLLPFLANLLRALPDHQHALCAAVLDDLELDTVFGNTPHSYLLAGVFVAGSCLLVVRVVQRPRTSPKPTSGQVTRRFLAGNGVLLLLSIVAYLVLGPSWTVGTVRHGNLLYLAPLYPPLFVGAGALFSAAGLTRTRGRRALVAVLLIALAAPLLLGLATNYRNNAAPRHRPDHVHCDERSVMMYFWNLEGADESSCDEPTEDAVVSEYDFAAGVSCCEASLSGERGACRFHSYLGRLNDNGTQPGVADFECSNAPAEDQLLCARAYGALHGSCDDAQLVERSNDEVCALYEGDAHDACVSGAFQGSFWRPNDFGCMVTIKALCDEGFETPHAHAACVEQVSALVYGMPALPPEPDPVVPECLPWPRELRGLCDRAVRLSQRPCVGSGEPCCEDVYEELLADEVPTHGSISYNTCLGAATDAYPYCAIGVLRDLGGTSCRWGGEPLGRER